MHDPRERFLIPYVGDFAPFVVAKADGAWVETAILRGEPAAGTAAEGPVIFELPESTLVLPPNWRAEVDGGGTIRAEAHR